MILLLLLLAAYLVGSTPTGYMIVRRTKKIDIREYGSGNVGAANVYRVAGARIAALVLLVDVLKGLIPVLLARRLLGSGAGVPLVGIAAIAGHIWPVSMGFKGGKGVLTSLGALLALAPGAGVISAVTGAAMMARFRYSSLGSLTGTLIGALVLLYLIITGRKPASYLLYVMAAPALILLTHRDNIQRLMAGTENRLAVGAKKKAATNHDDAA